MSFVGSNILAGASGQGGAGGYEIERSLRFNSADSAYLNRTLSANVTTFTMSFWFKYVATTRNDIYVTNSSYGHYFYQHTDGSFRLNNNTANLFISNGLYRDPSAWYHIVVTNDGSNFKLYVNGVLDKSASIGTYLNSGNFYIGNDASSTYANCYLADVHFIDGQALTADDFGETDDNGVWQPKKFIPSSPNNNTTWSNSVTGANNAPNGFNGNLSDELVSSTTGGTITFTASFSGVSTFRYYTTNSSAHTVGFNGGTAVNDGGGAGWRTITAPSSISSIEITHTNSGAYAQFAAIQINSVTLINGVGQYGTNGFHLPFTDNSSNAALGTDTSGNSNTWTVNNLSASAPGLATANQGMDVVTYSGNGGTQSISSLAFQPDFVWIKNRTIAYSHLLYDVIRGAGIGKALASDNTGAEGASSDGTTYGYLNTFNTNGFSVVQGSNSNSYTNGSGQNYVAWCWKAGGAASSNTDGTITSSVSANTTYGFSITSFTVGSAPYTVGHGLGSIPKLIIMKSKSGSTNWNVYHDSTGNQSRSYLNLTNGASSGEACWNSTSPTSSVFSMGSSGEFSGDMVAYCWSEVAGFSKISGYAGSGSSGNKITTGFRPRFLLIKGTDSTYEWQIFDSARNSSGNPRNLKLEPNTSDAEASTSNSVNFYDDGFDFNSNSDKLNGSSKNYIYAAFAAKPDGSVIDSLRDSPSQTANPTDTGAGGEVVGNYFTLNPLDSVLGSRLSNGNLEAVGNNNWAAGHTRGTVGLTSGKWYWEVEKIAGGAYAQIGFCNKAFNFSTVYGSLPADSWTLAFHNGTEILRPAGGGANYFSGGAMVVGDVLGIALDMDNKTAIFYKNGTAGATISLSSTKTSSTNNIDEIFPLVGVYSLTVAFNGGQRAFAYTAPSGYKSLNTANLPDPTIADGSKYFDTKLYTGNAGTNAQTGLGFSPDFLWIKIRNRGYNHNLFDSVRGNTKHTSSNLTNADYTESSGRGLTAFDSNGFTLGQDVQGPGSVNASGDSYVAWAWDAGSSNTTIAAGGLNSSVYDQSQTWSSLITPYQNSPLGSGNGTQIFDGSSSTQTTSNNTNGAGIKFTPTSNITGIIELWLRNGDTANSTFSYSVDGGSNFTNVTTVGGSGSFVNIGQQTITTTNGLIVRHITTAGTNGVSWRRMRVSGKELIDSGVSVTNVPSIASTVRANPSAGFSIVSFTGNSTTAAAVGHGLNKAPSFVVIKDRSTARTWGVFHVSGGKKLLKLDETIGWWNSGSNYWYDLPTSSVFYPDNTHNDHWQNINGNNYIAYCFAPVEGYSAMGAYEGNGSTDGPFVYTGFRPAFLIIKNTTSGVAEYWLQMDSERSPDNDVNEFLYPNGSGAEGTQYFQTDFLSNGFKLRNNSRADNYNNDNYIYLAFAENPFKTARAR